MSRTLEDLLGERAGERPALWVDAWDYGRELLLQGARPPWEDSGALLAHHRRLQGLVDSEVVVLEVGRFYEDRLDQRPDLLAAMAEKRRLGFALRTLLAEPTAREQLLDLTRALAESTPDRPLLLAMPGPRSWVAAAHGRARRVEPATASWDDAESGSMYLADFLRVFAGIPLGGILLREAPGQGAASDADRARYQPVANVAENYRWRVVLAGCDADYAAVLDSPVFLSLCPAGGERGIRELPPEIWAGAALPEPRGEACWHCQVPPDAQPERVLDLLAALRAEPKGADGPPGAAA